MLILPLHRAPTWANFPWATLALILANVFVFAALQSGDDRAREAALDHYTAQGLDRIEFPLYREWLDARGEVESPDALFERFAEANPRMAVWALQSNPGFLSDLHADRLHPAEDVDLEHWRAQRAEFETLWHGAFSERWMIRFSEFDPARMFGAMFLHGGLGHLIGNMVFLAILGLLVEGALGHGLFLALYLVGGLGSAMLSIAWRWGETGAALGASGAIAALMGAYCVLWGLRKVRFFWWFFVVFDYVKAPALVLLPFWLGWEVLNLFWNTEANVGFDAHAGGILAGAMLAVAVRALHWERRGFIDEDAAAEARVDRMAALAQAREHLGHLRIPAARALLEPLVEAQPDDFDARVVLYRCARMEPGMPRLSEAARAVLLLPSPDAARLRAQKAIYDETAKLDARPAPLTPLQALAFVRRWPTIGEGADAVLRLGEWIAAAPSTPGLRAACFAVAGDLHARGEARVAKPLLEQLVAAWPQSAEADQARVLLSP